MSRHSQCLANLTAAVRGFNLAPYANVKAADRKFIALNAKETADTEARVFDYEAARSFFDYVTARTRKSARAAWVD